jgi:hypothetical protein
VSGLAGVDQQELLLVPYTRAFELLKGRVITLSVITPPYPALGCGTLRVVRVTEEDNVVHLEATYDDFERLS